MNKKVFVVSGINMVDGGAKSVYHDFLENLGNSKYVDEYRIIALVADKKIYEEFSSFVEFIEFPKSKKSWIVRLYYEYIKFNFLSRKLNVDIWLSLHDMTPNVRAKKRFVYCHNPSPFYDMPLSEARYGVKTYLFSKFYKYLYQINIKKNTGVIVQQQWMRSAFERMYGINNLIVSHPNVETFKLNSGMPEMDKEETIFVYPSFPRCYKNFELLCEAAKQLSVDDSLRFKVFITLSGDENSYAKMLFQTYKDCKNIIFTGLLNRNELYQLYEKAHCLVFVSKLETWGLPITEFRSSGRPMILADLPYAKETVGSYQGVEFVDVSDVNSMMNSMVSVIETRSLSNDNVADEIREPYCNNWKELVEFLLAG